MGERLADVRRFTRVRRLTATLIALVALAVIQGVAGSLRISLPSAGGAITLPFRRELPLAFAVLVAATMNSGMSSFESAAARPVQRLATAHALALLALSGGLGVSVALWTEGPAEAAVFGCGLCTWFGMALLSGRLFGWSMAWALPMASVFPLIYYGLDDAGDPRWWDWVGQPTATWSMLGSAALALLAGILAVSLTPWRLHTLRRTTHAVRPPRLVPDSHAS